MKPFPPAGAPWRPARLAWLVLGLSTAAGGALVGGTLATGQTFGHRCERAGHVRGSLDWERCVRRLGRGEGAGQGVEGGLVGW